MQKTNYLFALFCLAGLVSSNVAAAEKLYKVIDQNGNVSYQDRPPIEEKSTVQIKTFENRTNQVDPENTAATDSTRRANSDRDREPKPNTSGRNNPPAELSSEDLTAIATGTSTNRSAEEGPGGTEIQNQRDETRNREPSSRRDFPAQD